MKAMKINALIGFLLLCSVTLFGFETERTITKPIRVMARGGTGVTAYNDYSVFFMNPAGLGVTNKLKLSFLEVGATANYDIYDLSLLAPKIQGGSFSNLTDDDWNKLVNANAVVGLSGPVALGMILDHFGLYIYDTSLVSAAVQQSAGLPYADFGAYIDVGVTAGYGFEVPLPFDIGKMNKFYVGATLKFINRIKLEDSRMSIIEMYDLANSLTSGERGILMGQAFGSDLGMLFKSENWSAGMVIRDWFSTQFGWKEYDINLKAMDSTNIPNSGYMPSFDIGGSYTLKTPLAKYLLGDIVFSMDLVDIFDWSENFWLKTRIGMEISTLWDLIKLRCGLYKGYPTVGLGLDIPLFNLNVAYYTEELGEMPGSKPQQTFVADLQIAF